MIRREATFQSLFRHWIRKNPQLNSCAFELKQTQGDSIAFSCVEAHQIDALMAVKTPKGLLYKAPDDSRGVKPFDMFYLRRANAFVVIKYPDFFVLIEVDQFVYAKNNCDRKSLTEDHARDIAEEVVELRGKKS